MNKPCNAFDMKEAAEAWGHTKYEVVRNYGDSVYGHFLHTWDDGGGCLSGV